MIDFLILSFPIKDDICRDWKELSLYSTCVYSSWYVGSENIAGNIEGFWREWGENNFFSVNFLPVA